MRFGIKGIVRLQKYNTMPELLHLAREAESLLGKAVKIVVPVKTVSATVTKISKEKQPDVDKVVVCAETAVEEVEPLSGLNMQLKRVHDGAYKTVDKNQ